MSKITFRADDDLVDAVEDLDASKSEVMRDALRAYLGEPEVSADDDPSDGVAAAIDAAVAERVDELVDRRFGASRPPERDVNVRITVDAGEGLRAAAERNADRGRGQRRDRGGDRGSQGERGRGDHASADRRGGEASCAQCGESLSDDHVYCPNCGEKATHRVFCECGDEVRADWAFCPHCGRRTASADALDG